MAAKKKPGERYLVVDGHAMAYRAHFAMAQQGLTNRDGLPTGAILGFFRMLLRLLQDVKPAGILMVFDPPGDKNFRFELFKEYKANRASMPDELRWQIEEIKTIIRALHLPFFEPVGFEADDAIASLARTWWSLKSELLIVSGDKDLFHVLSDNVRMLRPKKGVTEFIEIDPAWVKENIGVTTEQIPDYMALTGDTSDNVPGVKGIGEKTAAKLIQDYGNLDNLLEKVAEVKPAGVQAKLKEGRENALLSRELVTLRTDLETGFDEKNLKLPVESLAREIHIFKDRDFAALHNDFQKYVKTVSVPEKRSAAPEGDLFSAEGELPAEKPEGDPDFLKNFSIILTETEWKSAEKEIRKADLLAVDTETTGLDSLQAQLMGISLSWRGKEGVQTRYVPVVFDRENQIHFDYQSIVSGKEALAWLRPVLEDAGLKKTGQNIKYDLKILISHGINPAGFICDSMVMSFLLNPTQRRHNLDDLSESELGLTFTTYKELTGTGKKKQALLSLPLEEVARYAGEDAEATLLLTEKFSAEIDRKGFRDLYEKIDHPLIFTLLRMEQNGIGLDLVYLKKLEKDYTEKLNHLEQEIYRLAGETFNINSTRELQRILFQKLSIHSRKKTAKGAMSTEHSVLVSLQNEHEIIPILLDYRSYAKLLSTYITTLPGHLNPATGRIHTSFSQVTAATGRLASTDPNMQNIPIKGEDGRAIRRAFIAAEGNEILTLDYSQIELRLLAHYSRDENLLRAYRENLDIHDMAVFLLFQHQFDSATGKWIDAERPEEDLFYNASLDQTLLEKMKNTPEYNARRSQAKVLNFSIAYGVTEWGLSQNLGISTGEAKQLITLYFRTFPGIREYMKKAVDDTRQLGYSENLFGRRRYITDMNAKQRFQREAAERLAINNPIQSTAADIIKIAMIRVQNLLEEKRLHSRLLLQIHDELVLETLNEEKDTVFKLVKDAMENVVKLDVPLTVSGGFAANWEEAK